MDIKVIEEFLRFISDVECSVDDNFWWNSELRFFVDANDLFYWASSDCVEIKTQEDVDLLRSCFNEVGDKHFAELYCCRKNKMRPQGACYKNIDEKYWNLFDQCGPEREINFSNPVEK